jgi:hypothetical protein
MRYFNPYAVCIVALAAFSLSADATAARLRSASGASAHHENGRTLNLYVRVGDGGRAEALSLRTTATASGWIAPVVAPTA